MFTSYPLHGPERWSRAHRRSAARERTLFAGVPASRTPGGGQPHPGVREAGLRLWHGYLADLEADECDPLAADLELLLLAAQATDSVAELQEIVDGLPSPAYTDDIGAVRAQPILATLSTARRTAHQLLARLNSSAARSVAAATAANTRWHGSGD